ncbi:MAG: hypothetical protein AB1442_12295 [Nitrospirota bacterium]
MPLHFGEISDEDRFKRLENNCTDIRKRLMGALLLAKDLYKDELLKSPEGEEVKRSLEEAEDAFVDRSLTDRFARLENVLHVIQKRVQGLYSLMEYVSNRAKQ